MKMSREKRKIRRIRSCQKQYFIKRKKCILSINKLFEQPNLMKKSESYEYIIPPWGNNVGGKYSKKMWGKIVYYSDVSDS